MEIEITRMIDFPGVRREEVERACEELIASRGGLEIKIHGNQPETTIMGFWNRLLRHFLPACHQRMSFFILGLAGGLTENLVRELKKYCDTQRCRYDNLQGNQTIYVRITKGGIGKILGPFGILLEDYMEFANIMLIKTLGAIMLLKDPTFIPGHQCSFNSSQDQPDPQCPLRQQMIYEKGLSFVMEKGWIRELSAEDREEMKEDLAMRIKKASCAATGEIPSTCPAFSLCQERTKHIERLLA